MNKLLLEVTAAYEKLAITGQMQPEVLQPFRDIITKYAFSEIQGGVYLRLFHGRKHPNDHPEDWGSDGPVFGPLQYVHFTYHTYIHLGLSDAANVDLRYVQDMVHYDGVYYSDWSIFGEDELHIDKFTPEIPDGSKAS